MGYSAEAKVKQLKKELSEVEKFLKPRIQRFKKIEEAMAKRKPLRASSLEAWRKINKAAEKRREILTELRLLSYKYGVYVGD